MQEERHGDGDLPPGSGRSPRFASRALLHGHPAPKASELDAIFGDRIAVVTDKEWVRHTLHALAWMVPGEVALFAIDELDRAKEWAAAS